MPDMNAMPLSTADRVAARRIVSLVVTAIVTLLAVILAPVAAGSPRDLADPVRGTPPVYGIVQLAADLEAAGAAVPPEVLSRAHERYLDAAFKIRMKNEEEIRACATAPGAPETLNEVIQCVHIMERGLESLRGAEADFFDEIRGLTPVAQRAAIDQVAEWRRDSLGSMYVAWNHQTGEYGLSFLSTVSGTVRSIHMTPEERQQALTALHAGAAANAKALDALVSAVGPQRVALAKILHGPPPPSRPNGEPAWRYSWRALDPLLVAAYLDSELAQLNALDKALPAPLAARLRRAWVRSMVMEADRGERGVWEGDGRATESLAGVASLVAAKQDLTADLRIKAMGILNEWAREDDKLVWAAVESVRVALGSAPGAEDAERGTKDNVDASEHKNRIAAVVRDLWFEGRGERFSVAQRHLGRLTALDGLQWLSAPMAPPPPDRTLMTKLTPEELALIGDGEVYRGGRGFPIPGELRESGPWGHRPFSGDDLAWMARMLTLNASERGILDSAAATHAEAFRDRVTVHEALAGRGFYPQQDLAADPVRRREALTAERAQIESEVALLESEGDAVDAAFFAEISANLGVRADPEVMALLRFSRRADIVLDLLASDRWRYGFYTPRMANPLRLLSETHLDAPTNRAALKAVTPLLAQLSAGVEAERDACLKNTQRRDELILERALQPRGEAFDKANARLGSESRDYWDGRQARLSSWRELESKVAAAMSAAVTEGDRARLQAALTRLRFTAPFALGTALRLAAEEMLDAAPQMKDASLAAAAISAIDAWLQDYRRCEDQTSTEFVRILAEVEGAPTMSADERSGSDSQRQHRIFPLRECNEAHAARILWTWRELVDPSIALSSPTYRRLCMLMKVPPFTRSATLPTRDPAP